MRSDDLQVEIGVSADPVAAAARSGPHERGDPVVPPCRGDDGGWEFPGIVYGTTVPRSGIPAGQMGFGLKPGPDSQLTCSAMVGAFGGIATTLQPRGYQGCSSVSQ
ncbi:hypothetical protein [Nocardia xishanensis]